MGVPSACRVLCSTKHLVVAALAAVVVVVVVVVVTVTTATTTITTTRKYYKSCPANGVNDGWVCTSVQDYQHFQHYLHWRCFNNQSATTIPPSPPERCLLIDNMCQFSDSTLQCTFQQSWSNGCQYRCVEVNGSSWTNGSENCRYSKYDTQKKSGLTKYPAIYL